MLSYRHAYHAGNPADVLKHFVLTEIIRYMTQKDAPLWVVDTHAGAGMYALDTPIAEKLKEYREGILRLWQQPNLPEAIQPYLAVVKTCNGEGALKKYPGSPFIAQHLLRSSDRLRLYEQHSTDFRLLQKSFSEDKRRIQVNQSDGFAGLKAQLPPPSRRALVLIDPSYELSADYHLLISALQDALKRFATGTYAIWFPIIAKREAHELPKRLRNLGAPDYLMVTLTTRAPSREGIGMTGSGMFIINPPWTLESTLQDTLPALSRLLAQDDHAAFAIARGA